MIKPTKDSVRGMQASCETETERVSLKIDEALVGLKPQVTPDAKKTTHLVTCVGQLSKFLQVGYTCKY